MVLAFIRDEWIEASEPEVIEGIRAELRGLGASLLAVGHAFAWRFGPDDELEVVGRPEDVVPLLPRDARPTSPHRPAVFVIDADGDVRFAHQPSSWEADLPLKLVSALHAAGRALAAPPPAPTLTRREWLTSSLVGALALAFVEECAERAPGPAPGIASPQAGVPPEAAGTDLDVTLRVNGKTYPMRLDPRVSLLDALRERLALPGTKKGCDRGQCGACTVLVDGRRMNACLLLAVMVLTGCTRPNSAAPAGSSSRDGIRPSETRMRRSWRGGVCPSWRRASTRRRRRTA